MSTRGQKDPSLQAVLEAINGIGAAEIERKCGVASQTIRNWRNGKTQRPQNITLEFSLRAAGLKRIIVQDTGSR